MLRTIILCLGLFLTTLVLTGDAQNTQVTLASNDAYWLSYTSFLHDTPEGFGTKYLMKISSIGEVVVKPEKAVAPDDFKSISPATALSKNSTDTLNLWMVGKNGFIWRALIDKQTLTWLKLIKTQLRTDNVTHLKVTQKAHQNFLAVEKKADSLNHLALTALGISPSGIANDASWQLSTRLIEVDRFECGYHCGGAVSPDGRMALLAPDGGSDYESHLYVQPLNELSRPNGNSQLIATNSSTGLPAVSNALPGQIRFVIYKWINPQHSSTSSQLFLQTIQAQTAEKIGERITLTQREGEIGDFAIDPLGRFVVYAVQNDKNLGFLYFQALDLTGHPSGSPKVLVSKIIPAGIDILKEEQ